MFSNVLSIPLQAKVCTGRRIWHDHARRFIPSGYCGVKTSRLKDGLPLGIISARLVLPGYEYVGPHSARP